MRGMAHNEEEGHAGRSERERSPDNETKTMEGEAILPERNLVDWKPALGTLCQRVSLEPMKVGRTEGGSGELFSFSSVALHTGQPIVDSN